MRVEKTQILASQLSLGPTPEKSQDKEKFRSARKIPPWKTGLSILVIQSFVY
jgi:hypothetical protein